MMRGAMRARRSWVAALAAVVVAVPIFVVGTALPAGAVDVGNATDLASNFNNAAVMSITMTADITIDCGHLLDRTSANPITLDGAGHTLTQGCANNRVMRGAGLGALTLQDITVTGGDSPGSGGGVDWAVDVTVVNAHLTENHSEASGGGVHAEGSVVVTGSTFTSNTADDSGGGVAAHGNVTTLDSIFTNNEVGTGEGCDCSGGGFAALGAASVTRTTFLNNGAGDCADCGAAGGGFFTAGTATVIGSTFTSNRAGEECEACTASGGGFLSQGEATITDSTFTLNSAGNCGNCGAQGGGFSSGGDTSLTNSTLTDNAAQCTSSCGGQGGGASVFGGTFTIVGSTFTTNAALCDEACSGSGGGAIVGGNAEVSGSVFNGNRARCATECFGGKGGGLLVGGSTGGGREDIGAQADNNFLHVSHSAFVGNSATCNGCESGGGGILADLIGTATIDHSTLSGNATTGAGGAVLFDFGGNTATITNSTITENASATLGAVVSIGSGATLTLVYDTIVANTFLVTVNPDGAEAQAALDSRNVHVDGALVSVATVIALPNSGTNCSKGEEGTQTSQGYNFSDDLTCGFTNAATGDRQGAGLPPIGLGPLSSNGGVGETMLPLTGSPLLDFIPPAACRTGAAASVTDDERGVTRPQGPGCEIGAAEVLVAAALQPNFTG
jgi:hypothetical protein